ncbi:MAG: sugar ABC transporter permease [Clostridiales bacterium]|nr:sugar ABC transporter permease [Clostridiales bacterium]
MILPTLAYALVFGYLLMPGAYVALVDYKYAKGIFGSQFVGLRNFGFLLINGDLWRITRNTVLYNLAFVLLGNLIQMAVAVMLSEVAGRAFKRSAQSIMLFPYFISYVIVGVFAFSMFNYDTGTVNGLLQFMGFEKHDFYSDPSIWKYIIFAFYIWKGTGYGVVVYLAAILGINAEVVEAAHIDGANIFQRTRYLTLPSLKPTFAILLLFGLGGILNGQFDLFYNLIGTNSVLFPQTDIIDTYVYRSLLGSFNFANSSAVGLYQSFFGLVVVLTVNYVVRRVNADYALF